MALRDSTAEYGSLAKALHWLIAMGILAPNYPDLKTAGTASAKRKTRMATSTGRKLTNSPGEWWLCSSSFTCLQSPTVTSLPKNIVPRRMTVTLRRIP